MATPHDGGKDAGHRALTGQLRCRTFAAMKICPQCGAQYEMDRRFCSLDGAVLQTDGAAAGDEMIGTIIADRYSIVQKLGEGGWGRVYLAEHLRMRRKSAIKIMNPWLAHDTDAIARFNREAANAAQIAHPNVAAIYDFGEAAGGVVYLSMEYVDGESVAQLMSREGSLAAERVAGITRQIADGLEAAHELGIIHRDLKPDNILIGKSRSGGDRVKLVDFGIAKAMNANEQHVTRTGLIIGTPEYMSPEQLSGDPLDARSDQYSLGIVVFSMLTGYLPFPRVTTKETLIARLTRPPLQLAEVRPESAWSAALQHVLNRALAPDPGQRYPDVRSFATAVADAIVPGGLPAIAVPTTPPSREPTMTSPVPMFGAPSPPPVAPVITPEPTPPAAAGPPPTAAQPRSSSLHLRWYAGAAVVLIAVVGVWVSTMGAPAPRSPLVKATSDTDSIRRPPPPTPDTTKRERADSALKGGRGVGGGRAAGRGGSVTTGIEQAVKDATPAELLDRVQHDIQQAQQLHANANYLRADRMYASAAARIDSVQRIAAADPEAARLEREIQDARRRVRSACQTDNDIQRQNGRPLLTCP